MREPLATRVLAVVVGVFYLVFGVWALVAPLNFFSTIATFAPANVHLFHDLGAFQIGLGLALTLPVALRAPLRAPLIAVLAASLLHVLSHIEDIRLGGNPTTAIPVLTLVCVALAVALAFEVRAKRA